MKIEKISNNQIRCTLYKKDLIDRELKISELAYGSEKAKDLFRDMMQQASYELGFDAEDIPLMIEAIPLSDECIILTITKVENPDELDTRFSKFSSEDQSEGENGSDSSIQKGADEILDLYKHIQEEKARLEKQKNEEFVPLDKTVKSNPSGTIKQPPKPITDIGRDVSFNLVKIFKLNDLDTICQLSVILKNFYHGSNSLYKDAINQRYYLILNKDRHTPEEFNKTCNILSEYGVQEKYTSATEAYYREHFQIIIKNNALQVLSSI